MDVSIIIVNYNTREMTAECIESVFRMTAGIEFEVILVDNASTDGSKEYFELDSRITYLYNEENVGFGRANNKGYEYASGKYIFLLNSDTLLLNNSVKLFLDFAERMDSDIACLGCSLVDHNNQPMHSYGFFPTLRRHILDIFVNYIPGFSIPVGIVPDDAPESFSVEYITGADLFIRRSVIEQYGFFDPAFFMYYEETDLQKRYAKEGYLSVIIRTPRIMHLHFKNRKPALRHLRLPIEGSYIYYRKHYPRWKYVLVRFFYLLLIPKVIIYPDTIGEKMKLIRLLCRYY